MKIIDASPITFKVHGAAVDTISTMIEDFIGEEFGYSVYKYIDPVTNNTVYAIICDDYVEMKIIAVERK